MNEFIESARCLPPNDLNHRTAAEIVPNEYVVIHAAGEFLVRTSKVPEEVYSELVDRWGIEAEMIAPATSEDIERNQGQWTELDTDI